MNWHIQPTTARRYASRNLDGVTTASVEAHLMGCQPCRTLISESIDAGPLDDVWRRIDATLDAPGSRLVERLLTRCRLGEATTRLVTATTMRRWSYLGAVAISILISFLAATHGGSQAFTTFLIAAPIGPLLATTTVYGRWFDPAHEIAVATPTPGLRVLLVRASSTTVPAIVLTALAIPWTMTRGWLAVAWLLPSVALSVAVIAVASWASIETAGLVVGAAWLLVPLVLRLAGTGVLDALGEPTQLVSLAVVAVCAAAITGRRHAFDYQGR